MGKNTDSIYLSLMGGTYVGRRVRKNMGRWGRILTLSIYLLCEEHMEGRRVRERIEVGRGKVE
jgi:hypothetical protein